MSAGRQKRTQEIGITHFPLDDEQQSQNRVPSRQTNARANKGGGGSHGHRLSREQEPESKFARNACVERAAKAVRREVRVQDSLPRTRELLEERAYELNTIERGVILSTNRIC